MEAKHDGLFYASGVFFIVKVVFFADAVKCDAVFCYYIMTFPKFHCVEVDVVTFFCETSCYFVGSCFFSA